MWQKFRRVAAYVALATSAIYAVFLYTQISGMPPDTPVWVAVGGFGGFAFFLTAALALFIMGGGGRWEHQILVLLIALLSLPLWTFVPKRLGMVDAFVRDGALLWQFVVMLLVLLDFVLWRGTSMMPWQWRKKQAGYVIAGFLVVLGVVSAPRFMPAAKAPTGTMSVVRNQRQPTVVCPHGTEAVVVLNRRNDGESVSVEARRLRSRRSKMLTWRLAGDCPPPTVLQVFSEYPELPLCVAPTFWNTVCAGKFPVRRAVLPLSWKPLEWQGPVQYR